MSKMPCFLKESFSVFKCRDLAFKVFFSFFLFNVSMLKLYSGLKKVKKKKNILKNQFVLYFVTYLTFL